MKLYQMCVSIEKKYGTGTRALLHTRNDRDDDKESFADDDELSKAPVVVQSFFLLSALCAADPIHLFSFFFSIYTRYNVLLFALSCSGSFTHDDEMVFFSHTKRANKNNKKIKNIEGVPLYLLKQKKGDGIRS